MHHYGQTVKYLSDVFDIKKADFVLKAYIR